MSANDSIDAGFFKDLTRTTNFYIVRHGESVANAQNRIQGHSDFPLNERGRAQAAEAGRWFRGKNVARLLCSPLSRAFETAAILASEAGFQPPVREPLLVELDTGKFSGLTLEEARDRHPEDWDKFSHMSWEGVSDAERSHELAARARLAWAAIKAAAVETGGDVLALSHGGTIQWLVRVTFGCESWMPLLSTGNCGVFHLVVEPTGGQRPAYLQWREMNYLPGDPGLQIKPVF